MVLSKKAVQRNTVLVAGGGERIKAGVAQENISHIISRLTNLYGNPVQAAVREVFSNALDATMSMPEEEREAILISSPTVFEPQLTIQDFGCGMSIEDVRKNYANYGVSTKEDNLKAMGSYGLGGKAPLAYTDNFTVETTKDGVTTVFIMQTINGEVETEIISSEETGYDSGTKVTIPVKPLDVHSFAKVLEVYKNFSWSLPVEIDGELYNGSEAYVDGGEALIFLDKDTEVYGTIRINRKAVAELLNAFSSYSSYRNKLEDYIDYELGGWVYGADGSSYEGELKPVVVSIVPALVDFSSSRDSITSNEKLEELNKLVKEALHDEVLFQTLFEIFRGYSNDELRSFSKELNSSTIKLKGDRFQVKNDYIYKVIFEGPISLMDTEVGINPYFLSSTELPGNAKVAFGFHNNGTLYVCRTSRQSLFSAAFSSDVVNRIGVLSEQFDGENGFALSYYSSAVYSSDEKVILVTATSAEDFKLLVRRREALKSHFDEKALFVFSKLPLEKQDSRDMEYTKKLLGDRFSSLDAVKLLENMEATRKSLLKERKSSREDKANESLEKRFRVVKLVGDYSKPEEILEMTQRDSSTWLRLDMSVKELAASGAAVILSGYYGWKGVYIGAVNAGEPILNREIYFSSEPLDQVQWKFLTGHKERIFMSPQTQKLKVARELASERAFHGSALNSVLESYSEEQLLSRCVPQKINYEVGLRAIQKRLGTEDSLLNRYIEISQNTEKDVIPVLDFEARAELEKRGYPVATITGFDEAVRSFFVSRNNSLEETLIYTAFISSKELAEDSPLTSAIFDRAAEQLKASFNRWLVV